VRVQGALAATLDDLTSSAQAQIRVRGVLSATLADATIASEGSLPIAGVLAATLGNATLSASIGEDARAAGYGMMRRRRRF
jgi:hypothetical protein